MQDEDKIIFSYLDPKDPIFIDKMGRRAAHAVELFLSKAVAENTEKLTRLISSELVEGSWNVNLREIMDIEIRNILIEVRISHPQIESAMNVKKYLESLQDKIRTILRLYKHGEIKVTGSLDAVLELTQMQQELLNEIEFISKEIDKACT